MVCAIWFSMLYWRIRLERFGARIIWHGFGGLARTLSIDFHSHRHKYSKRARGPRSSASCQRPRHGTKFGAYGLHIHPYASLRL